MANNDDGKRDMEQPQVAGRVEITDKAVIDALNLRPDRTVLDEIKRLEEAAILAEQKLGTLRVA